MEKELSLWEAAAFKDVNYFVVRFGITISHDHKRRFSLLRKKERRVNKYNLPTVTFPSSKNHKRTIEELNTKNQFGINAFHTAIFYNNFQVFKLFLAVDPSLVNNPLMRSKGDDDSISWTYPIHLAIIFGHKKIFKTLLRNGADPFLRDNLGQNAWDVTRVTFQKKFWHRLDKWCKGKRKTIEAAPKVIGISKKPTYQKRSYSKSQECLVSKRLIDHKLIKSFDDIRTNDISSYKKVPHGPWDLEGCFIKAACGICPEISDVVSEKSASSFSETESTTTLMTTSSMSSLTKLK